MKTKTETQSAAQSVEDKQVVNIKKVENGFTIRVDSKTFVYSTLHEVIQFITKQFEKKCNCKGSFHDETCPLRVR